MNFFELSQFSRFMAALQQEKIPAIKTTVFYDKVTPPPYRPVCGTVFK